MSDQVMAMGEESLENLGVFIRALPPTTRNHKTLIHDLEILEMAYEHVLMQITVHRNLQGLLMAQIPEQFYDGPDDDLEPAVVPNGKDAANA